MQGTPNPRGYPRQSASFNNIVTKPLTDEQIHKYQLKGLYGHEAKKRAEQTERDRKIAKRDIANLKARSRKAKGSDEVPNGAQEIMESLKSRGIIL